MEKSTRLRAEHEIARRDSSTAWHVSLHKGFSAANRLPSTACLDGLALIDEGTPLIWKGDTLICPNLCDYAEILLQPSVDGLIVIGSEDRHSILRCGTV